MRKFIGLALLVSLASLAAFAQEGGNTPKAEIFGGYQYTRFDGGVNANGWNTSLTGNLNNWFGIAWVISAAHTIPRMAWALQLHLHLRAGDFLSPQRNLHSVRTLPGRWQPRLRFDQWRWVWIG